MKETDVNKARKKILNGLKKLEEVRNHVANCRIEAESRLPNDIEPKDIPEARQQIMKELLDGWNLEKDLQEALVSMYDGLKTVYTDWEAARSIDGDIPIWPETRS